MDNPRLGPSTESIMQTKMMMYIKNQVKKYIHLGSKNRKQDGFARDCGDL